LHRFLDMGIESFLLASAMLAVVGQRLVRRNCTHCLETYEPAAEELSFYERAGGSNPEGPFKRGRGCAVCSDTGYYGRVGVYEVLRITDEMRELMVQNAQIEEMRKLGVSQGMVPMREQAIGLVDQGVTTVAEVMRTVYVV
jgi:type IV pilus assembly protein PilB